MIIGVDYHPSFQAIAFCVEEIGECGEQELNHSDGQAEKFYRDLQQRGLRVRVGMEATGYSRGSSGYWLSWVSSCGSAIPPKLRPSG
jgi:transposase